MKQRYREARPFRPTAGLQPKPLPGLTPAVKADFAEALERRVAAARNPSDENCAKHTTEKKEPNATGHFCLTCPEISAKS